MTQTPKPLPGSAIELVGQPVPWIEHVPTEDNPEPEAEICLVLGARWARTAGGTELMELPGGLEAVQFLMERTDGSSRWTQPQIVVDEATAMPEVPEETPSLSGQGSYGDQLGAEVIDGQIVADRAEALEADDTVPVERLAHWLHGEFDTSAEDSDLLPWAQEREGIKDRYRRTARALMSQLPELFR